MQKKTLSSLFAEWLFRIPDYQRGYAWEEKQWNDFIEDVDALVYEDVKNHYTGTVVVFQDERRPVEPYGPTRRYPVVDVVDGQQRLTTCCLYLSIVLHSLVERGVEGYESEIPNFLYAGTKCRLTLNNDTEHFFYDLLKNGHPNAPVLSTHQKRLIKAHQHFKKHIDKQIKAKGTDYLTEVYDAITRKLVFTFYTIEEESEIGMTFELMNSRGKDLSVLELLKNYLMHWVARNVSNDAERQSLTNLINNNWKTAYTNIGSSNGNEDQCLRIAWILYCNPTPKNWEGYRSFKGDQYFPLRNFKVRSKENTKEAIEQFADGLAEISRHYSQIINPAKEHEISEDETKWLSKIHHGGNISNFLPLIVAARIRCESGKVGVESYVDLLNALEIFAYRVFLFEGKRSNAGRSTFFRLGYDLFHGSSNLAAITQKTHNLTRYYSEDKEFQNAVQKPFEWYDFRHLLRYTLYEYELYLLETEGKHHKPKLKWEDLSDSTIEHILPQTIQRNSPWRVAWEKEDIGQYQHDIGNLVLTRDNSSYLNFDFQRKKGKVGISPSYANSDIRQERKIASFADWTPKTVAKRHKELTNWIATKWATREDPTGGTANYDDYDDKMPELEAVLDGMAGEISDDMSDEELDAVLDKFLPQNKNGAK
jgi:hypothetical protein